MRTKLVLAAAAIVAIGSIGCTSRPLRSVFYRGAPCGATTATSDVMTTYSPGCGGCGVAGCSNCDTTSGVPMVLGDGYSDGYFGDPVTLPGPGTVE